MGRFLAQYRIKAGLTQSDVAHHFGYDSAQHISNVENGRSPASLELFKGLIDLYCLDKNHVFELLTKDFKNYLDKELRTKKKGRRS